MESPTQRPELDPFRRIFNDYGNLAVRTSLSAASLYARKTVHGAGKAASRTIWLVQAYTHALLFVLGFAILTIPWWAMNPEITQDGEPAPGAIAAWRLVAILIWSCTCIVLIRWVIFNQKARSIASRLWAFAAGSNGKLDAAEFLSSRDPGMVNVILTLRRRASRTRGFAKLAMISVLLTGMYALSFGYEEITGNDWLQSSVADMEVAISNAKDSLNSARESYAGLSDDPESRSEDLADAAGALASVSDTIEEARTATGDVRRELLSTRYLIFESLGRRVCVLLLLLLVFQTFSALYRYLLRLAASYDNRADALILAQDRDANSIVTLSRAFSPEMIDFPKQRQPFDAASDFVQSAIRR